MENENLRKFVEQIINQKLDSMVNMVTPFHQHNDSDSPRIDPAIGLTGFPVNQTSTPSVAPTDIPGNGKFRFQVDTSGNVYFWAYTTYTDAGVITGTWKSVQLT